MLKIDRVLASQVVNTVKDVCGRDVNFINASGIIFASTDPERIGTFHEIGHQAAMNGQTIEVQADDHFHGTRMGINLPIYYNQTFMAVIGITGEPEEVRKYAHLAERITHLLIRERELNTISRNLADKRHFVMEALIHQTSVNIDYLNECLKDCGIHTAKKYRILLIHATSEHPLDNLSLLEQKIHQFFDMLSIRLYTFYYPNEYAAVIDPDQLTHNRYILEKFSTEHQTTLKLAIGKACSVYQLADSYKSARTAMKHFSDKTEGFILFDELDLELIFSGLSRQEKDEFLNRTLSAIDSDDRQLLRTYFDNDMSLSKTSSQLFIHKNTLQYRLNHIFQKSGLNPRAFKDAVLLYLGLNLE